MKPNQRNVCAKRYREYQRSFFVLGILYVLSFCVGALLWSKLSLTSFGESLIQSTGRDLFAPLSGSYLQRSLCVFVPRLLNFLLLFLFGVTVYAPVAAGAVSLWQGLSGGVSMGFLFRFLSEGMSVWILIADLLFFFLSAALFLMYASFSVCVCFKQMGVIADADSRMFGGTLFCGRFEKKRVNLRFLLSYQLFFLMFVLCQLLLTLAYRLLLDFLIGL